MHVSFLPSFLPSFQGQMVVLVSLASPRETTCASSSMVLSVSRYSCYTIGRWKLLKPCDYPPLRRRSECYLDFLSLCFCLAGGIPDGYDFNQKYSKYSTIQNISILTWLYRDGFRCCFHFHLRWVRYPVWFWYRWIDWLRFRSDGILAISVPFSLM